ncbi:MAG: oligomeric, coiled-coil, peripheral membrane protein [Geoglossum umbratile]|nr:MAG: oligomeric, coiled-coil, peripheral membrane protein [Geoglossum umbratile]
MSLQIFIAHTGERLRADPVLFNSLDAFRSWISRGTSIAPQNQILMTARGKQVKLQTLLTDNEIFIYDRIFISPPSSASAKSSSRQTPVPPVFSPKAPPDILTSQTDLQAWQNLFLSRKSWALDLLSKCASMSESVQKQYEEVAVIERAVRVAIANLETHVRSLEQRYTEAKTWAGDVLKEHQAVIAGRDIALTRLASIPVKETLLQFIAGRNSNALPSPPQRRNTSKGPTLADFVDTDDVKRAGAASRDITQSFASRVAELGEIIDKKIVSSSQELVERVKRDAIGSAVDNSEESKPLLEDIEVVTKKVNSDYEHVLGLANSPKSVSQASKMALLHTRNYLPSLSESSVEMGQILRHAVEQRNTVAMSAEQHLQAVSAVESMLANINPQLSSLDIGTEGVEAFDLLNLVSRLPAAYGSLLVEAVRRREWSEKIKADSSTLAEELAILKDEEERRRKKWQRNIGSFVSLDTVDDKALRVEVNLQGEGQPWPHITRLDIDDFIKVIRSLEGMDGVAKEMALLVKDLDRPTRHQSRRAKAFKMGSVHEAALGRSSLLLRGDDDLVRSLKVEKSKLEDKLKGSESRVRRLEDLLHRQSHVSRNSSGNVFQVGNPHGQQSSPVTHNTSLPSPRPDDALSRRSSISSRRFSVNQSPEEKALAQRILTLETELTSEREHAAGLQKEVFARKEAEKDIRVRIEEANSTKKDLMANLEAQQQEFVDERKLLEEDIAKHKARVEEVEDELDRVLGSRENEKARTDQKIHTLETELEKTRKEAADEIERLRQQVNHHREMTDNLDKTMEQAKSDKRALQDRVKRLELQSQLSQETQSDHVKALRAAHLQLSPKEVAPQDLAALVEGLEALAERSAYYCRDLENQLAIAHADIGALQTKVIGLEKEQLAAKDKLGSEEMESFTLREALSEVKAITSALRSELEDERLQLSKVRAKLTDGETGSFALREKLAEAEEKAARLVGELGVSEAKSKALEEELELILHRVSNMQAASKEATSRLESRTARAKDLTQRLYVQNDRLSRLLELLGFVITRRDDSMVIQRVSRTGSASITDSDPTSGLSRSISGAAPSRRPLEDSGDLELLYWMRADDSDAESEKFEAFISKIGMFDLDAFSEAITKRVKETEHMARKWQKEARAYRDKSHRAQLEAHEKIAFRSFKEGDLALFLPTRNQATRPWAAFNVGAPHYFLREQDSHKLRTRDWLLARISKVQERVVDLSKCMSGVHPAAGDRRSIGESSDGGASFEDENPFELSDGLRWYLLDAAEEKPGAPTTPGLGKSTVASAHVDAKGSIRVKKTANQASKTLSKSLDSRRGSTSSKKDSTHVASNTPAGAISPDAPRTGTPAGLPPSTPASPAALKAPEEAIVNQEVREDRTPPRGHFTSTLTGV